MKTISSEEFSASESIIDTNYFGVKSAKVILKKACVSDQIQNELLNFLENFEFVVITNQANDPCNNQWLGEKSKAFLTDINVQFRKEASETKGIPPSIRIADTFPENFQILRIAENAFTVSRFLNDPYLPVEKAKHIYADMARNAFGTKGRFFVTYQEKETIGGFLLFSIDFDHSSSTIELIAIDQSFIGRGAGRSLIRAMENYVFKEAVNTIKVGTQLNNMSALSFYTSCGFRYAECSSIYHYWPLRS